MMTIKDLYEKIGVFIEQRTLLILAVAVLLMFASFYGAQKIEIATGTDTFVKKESRLYQDFDYLYKQNFGTEAIVVLVESDDIVQPEIFKAIDRLEKQLHGREHIIDTISIVSFIKSAQSQTKQGVIPSDKNTIENIIKQVPVEYTNRLIPDHQHTLVYVEMPGSVTEDNKKEVLHETENAVKWADFPAGTSTIVTGDPAFMISMQNEMNKSMGTMLIISIILMVFALSVVFGHVRWRLLPLPIVLIGIIWTFGAMGFTGIPMTMVSMAVFPILIGLGVDYAIQFHNRAEEELARGETASLAIIETAKHMGPAVGTAVVATSLGFVALFISPVPMINDFGWMGLIGVILCYLISLFVLVPVLYLLDRRAEMKAPKNKNKKSKKVETKFGKMLGSLAVKTANNPIIVIGIAGILTIAGLYADEHVDVQTDVKKFVPDDMAAMIDLNKLHDLLGGTDNLNLIVKSDDVTNPRVLKWMYEFGEREVELHGDIKRADSIATNIKITTGSIPNSPLDINALPALIKERYLYGNTMSVIDLNIGTAADLGTARVSRIIEDVKSDIEWYPPPTGTKITVTGNQVALTSIMGALTSGRTFMTILGLVMIFLGLLVIYRDPIHAFVPILPILMVTGWAGGVMYLLNIKYNPLTATLGALVIGIGAEFTILMMERYYEERDKGKLPIEAMETAASRIGQAILASGSTVLFGFSALIFTPFPILSSFGVVTVISVAFTLISTLVVLPPVMVSLDKWIKVKNLTSKNKPF